MTYIICTTYYKHTVYENVTSRSPTIQAQNQVQKKKLVPVYPGTQNIKKKIFMTNTKIRFVYHNVHTTQIHFY